MCRKQYLKDEKNHKSKIPNIPSDKLYCFSTLAYLCIKEYSCLGKQFKHLFVKKNLVTHYKRKQYNISMLWRDQKVNKSISFRSEVLTHDKGPAPLALSSYFKTKLQNFSCCWCVVLSYNFNLKTITFYVHILNNSDIDTCILSYMTSGMNRFFKTWKSYCNKMIHRKRRSNWQIINY